MENKLKKIREKKGYTQVQLAKKSGVCRTVISGLETGSWTQTTTGTLRKIAAALDVSVTEIFFSQEV